MAVTENHLEHETLVVDVEIPGHAERTTTSLFRRTRLELIAREKCCFVCGRTAETSGHPLEAHHHPVERSLATGWAWDLFALDCKAGLWGAHAQAFDWDNFDPVSDPYAFVDDMRCNGLVLCKDHHVGKDEGIHMLPFPIFLFQRYAKEGYQFSPTEVIHHAHS